MSLKIYWGSGSPVSWRVLLALAIKNIEYESIRLNLSEKEFRSDAYLALNPRGTFPLLVSDSIRVRGSLAILAYLEKLQPTPALFGDSAKSTALIWQSIGDHEDFLGPQVETVTRAYFRKNGNRSPEALAPSISVIANELSSIDRNMTSPWLVGEHVSAADLVFYPTLQRLLRAAGKPDADLLREVLDSDLGQYPNIRAWLATMNTLPGVEDTYPPHWRAQ